MSNYGWTNEEGEPVMDGAAYRFEQQLDMDSRDDYMADHFYDDDFEEECPEDHDCEACDGPTWAEPWWKCSYCDRKCPDDSHDGAPRYRDGMGPSDPVRCDND